MRFKEGGKNSPAVSRTSGLNGLNKGSNRLSHFLDVSRLNVSPFIFLLQATLNCLHAHRRLQRRDCKKDLFCNSVDKGTSPDLLGPRSNHFSDGPSWIAPFL